MSDKSQEVIVEEKMPIPPIVPTPPISFTKIDIAIEEWKMLSSIIGRLEDIEYKMRSWLFALITGLSIALYSKEINISWYSFIIIGYALIILFVLMDLMHRMPKRRAIERSKIVEDFLKKGGVYDGPKISESLKNREGKWQEFKQMLPNTPYIQIFIIITLIGLGTLIIK